MIFKEGAVNVISILYSLNYPKGSAVGFLKDFYKRGTSTRVNDFKCYQLLKN